MPNIDGGHYFLTAIFPIKDGDVVHNNGQLSTTHAVRQTLACLPVYRRNGLESPFARDSRTHFVRIFVLDDVIYNGRLPKNTLLDKIYGSDLLKFEKIDELKSPYLVFSADFDAPKESDEELNSYLKKLWCTSLNELKKIFHHCYGFEKVKNAEDFCAFVRKGQIETTMSFNDYFIEPPKIKSFPSKMSILLGGLFVSAGPATLLWLKDLMNLAGALLLFLGVLIFFVLILYRFILMRGKKSFPIALNSTLPAILKAIYLNKQFTQFAIDQQGNDADNLYKAFEQFVKKHKPCDLQNPSQKAGWTSQKD